MSKLLNVSIDLTKIDKSKIIEGKKGGKYLNMTVWINDELDQYGNDVSVQQSQSKEEREAKSPKVYLGNGRVYRSNKVAQAQEAPAPSIPDADLPF